MRSLSLVFASVFTVSGRDTVRAGPEQRRSAPRRAWFGVTLAPAERRSGHVRMEGSTAAAEGIRAGDVIRAVDDVVMRTPNDVIATIGRHSGGDVATIDIIRDGRAQRQSVRLRPMLKETMPGVTFEYGSVTLPMAVACARSCQCPTSVRRLSPPSCSCQAAAAAVWIYPSPPMSRSLDSCARLPRRATSPCGSRSRASETARGQRATRSATRRNWMAIEQRSPR